MARYCAWSGRTVWVMPSSAHRNAAPISATSSSAARSACQALGEIPVSRELGRSSELLVPENGEVRLAARHRRGADEQIFVRHVDGVGGGPVVGLLAAMHDPGADRGKKRSAARMRSIAPSGSGAAGGA